MHSGREEKAAEIDTVIFDVGGVLTDFRPDLYFLQKGYSKEIAQRLQKVTMGGPDWVEYDRGVLTDEEIRARFKKEAPDLAREIDASLTVMEGIVTRRESAIPWIESVKAMGCRTYCLSNF